MASTSCAVELERYIQDFLRCHTAEEVGLYMGNDIQIRHASRKGHIMLAVLWANILQHELNFPQNKYIYTQAYDEETQSDVLIVPTDKAQLMVNMTTGTLRISGRYIYEWFARSFRQILDNYDPTFPARWQEPRTASAETPRCLTERAAILETCQCDEKMTLRERRTATEDYLLLLTNRHIYDGGHFKKIMEEAKNIDIELSRMALSQHVWKGSDLSHQVSLLSDGSVRDGYSHVYKLWRSLLLNWFGSADTRVFLCSPCLDERCLSDILDLYLPYFKTADIVSIFTQRKCNGSTNNQNRFFEMKRKLLQKYPKRSHSVIEYKVYRSLLYPSSKFSCRFIAGVANGKAKVMVTSADFNMDHFVSGNMEFVFFREMSENIFMREYISPLTDQAIVLE